ncbi:hypothetical protein [Bifidobacterium avesanii]|uniref:Uncharacterized protein n=1 Tax=Bifidobacterium avesanii TaxID=1798157 RepID=A0A7K3TET4_9BIFI|nr:hypothetical protein [Bifidobacterium avesanii]KAB8295601.1 hypothetical protein DSM100685_0211 [Bifidobacterium avesanii]NEG77605.1 hypothetical protein [Bifidobacterium avesanii]
MRPIDDAPGGRIPYPDKAERDASVAMIVTRGMPARMRLVDSVAELVRSAGLRSLFFGVWDCVFLGCLAAACVWGLLAAGADGFMQRDSAAQGRLMILMFLASPFLYEFVHLLIMLRERERRTLDLWRVCRWSFHRLAAVRMLAFGAASVTADTMGCVVVSALSGRRLPVLTMLGVSFASLFLFALGQLAVDARCAWPASAAVMPVAWLAAGGAAWAFSDRVAGMMERLPAAVSLGIAAALAVAFLYALRRYMNVPASRRAEAFA